MRIPTTLVIPSFLAITLLQACTHSGAGISEKWITLNVDDTFSISAPPGTEYVPARGIDSFIGYLRNERFGLQFDYGRHGGPFSAENRSVDFPESHLFEETQINGKRAIIKTGETHPLCPKFTSAHVEVEPNPTGEDGITDTLYIFSCLLNDRDLKNVHRMFRSLRFPE
ncbi:MAG: hypothetical protein DHS20C05_19950 [Hyphococcus sp.]|nr:MAG: hypothetical protein DHS20C05_19950 [Marinicaulis sp.]